MGECTRQRDVDISRRHRAGRRTPRTTRCGSGSDLRICDWGLAKRRKTRSEGEAWGGCCQIPTETASHQHGITGRCRNTQLGEETSLVIVGGAPITLSVGLKGGVRAFPATLEGLWIRLQGGGVADEEV